jgi:hypothetical protein
MHKRDKHYMRSNISVQSESQVVGYHNLIADVTTLGEQVLSSLCVCLSYLLLRSFLSYK